MGVRSGVKENSRSNMRLVRLGVDVPLLLTLFTLIVFGLLILYSASWDFSRAVTETNDEFFIFRRQLLFLVVGLGVATFAAFFNYKNWEKLALPAMLLTIVLLAIVIVISEVRLGAVRALNQGSYQPSELAKLVMVIYLSVWLYSKREYLNKIWFGLVPLTFILGIVGGLILLQPDLSAVLTVVFIGGLMFFLAGGDLRQILIVIVFTCIFGWAVVSASETGRNRIETFWGGLQNPEEASYHVQRSLESFVKGGWFGKGIGQADTKHTGLPVPPTDSIYAVIGEETGVVGATFVLALYTVLLWRGLEIARNAPNQLGSLLAGGLSIWVAMEAFINMAVILGLLPFAGNALPFMSSGGSSLLTSLFAMGIVINVSRMSEKETLAASARFSDVVDLKRRRDERPPRYTSPPQKSKPIGDFSQKPVGTKMAVRDSKTRRAKRGKKD